MRVASRGVGLVAGRDVARCVREMTEADVVSGTLPEAGEGCSAAGGTREINATLETGVRYCKQ